MCKNVFSAGTLPTTMDLSCRLNIFLNIHLFDYIKPSPGKQLSERNCISGFIIDSWPKIH